MFKQKLKKDIIKKINKKEIQIGFFNIETKRNK
jgi:hypothetical protein